MLSNSVRFLSKSAMASRKSVFVTRQIPKQAIELLEKHFQVTQHDGTTTAISREDLIQGVSNVDGLLCLLTDKIDSKLLENAPKLTAVSTMSVGYDHLDLSALRHRNIRLGYTPDVLTEATAELTIALLLSVSRRLREAARAVTSGAWGTWSPLWMCGSGLCGSTVGVYGMGRIGQSVVTKINAFNPGKVIYTGRSRKMDAEAALKIENVNFEQLLKESDFLIICASLTPETKHVFNTAAFDMMKPTSILMNTSRGGLVDHSALYTALSTGRLGAAGLDVCDPEPMDVGDALLSLDNCLVLPHIGSATIESRTAMAMLAAENLIAALENEKMPAEIPV